MRIERDAVAALLPHRDPIALVQSVRVDEPGHSGRAVIAWPEGSELMAGLTTCRLTPELLLEGAAQALGVVLGSGAGAGEAGTGDERHLLVGFNDVTYGATPRDDAGPLEAEIRCEESSGSTHLASFRVVQGDLELVSGSVMVLKGAAA